MRINISKSSNSDKADVNLSLNKEEAKWLLKVIRMISPIDEQEELLEANDIRMVEQFLYALNGI